MTESGSNPRPNSDSLPTGHSLWDLGAFNTDGHDATGRTFSFDAAGAIFCWVRESAHKGSGGLRVTTASLPAWKQVACDKALGSATDYDWTFTTDYSLRRPVSPAPVGSEMVATARPLRHGSRLMVEAVDHHVTGEVSDASRVRLVRDVGHVDRAVQCDVGVQGV